MPDFFEGILKKYLENQPENMISALKDLSDFMNKKSSLF